MSILITDTILQQANMSEHEFRLEIALMLFQKEVFTLGQASTFVEVAQFAFQQEMARREIPMHYGEEEFEEDLARLKDLPR